MRHLFRASCKVGTGERAGGKRGKGAGWVRQSKEENAGAVTQGRRKEGTIKHRHGNNNNKNGIRTWAPKKKERKREGERDEEERKETGVGRHFSPTSGNNHSKGKPAQFQLKYNSRLADCITQDTS
jgi:hypothetical protein